MLQVVACVSSAVLYYKNPSRTEELKALNWSPYKDQEYKPDLEEHSCFTWRTLAQRTKKPQDVYTSF